ncbi:glutamyl-tRNA amidotransferase [Actinophytocola xinjiangensis]|uniref:Glutamyl-tRNA amidotransferase n=1 Tax=Actinophytocola xinjiangensis TaxID=485602 RepID=A0A7Z1AWI3_9PSEU|nr:GatB/YqeY domain-containing protein [Actinophytocola xinjiangensis]OLF07718.1 glutamyl-tRNA amidotransferase [Actinophytocola xinjiangensis]
MAELKARLQADLSAAIKNRETVRMASLRMALAAVTTEEVAGTTARELADDEVVRVLAREVKKRKEAAEAFDGAGRVEQAQAERDEAAVLGEYLPRQLSDEELEGLVAEAVAEVSEALGSAPGQRQMGQVMKVANGKVAGRAEGGRVAGFVRARLQG